jgi:L-fuculose-phosphate aldolase
VNEATARRDLVRYSRQMHAAGWVANHDGNLSARVGQSHIVCTPTAFSKLDIGSDDLVVTDLDGKQRSGSHKPFSELGLHRAVYAARSEVRAVVHAHPPYATAFGVSGRPVPHPFLPEAVVSLGAELPTVPVTAPGEPAVGALKAFVRRCDAVLLAGNGALAWGPDLETAYLRLELLEHICHIAHTALPLGGPKLLPADMVADLLGKRAKAGLAAPEEGKPTGAGADVAQRAAQRAVAAIPNVDPALAARIAAEVAKRMGG